VKRRANSELKLHAAWATVKRRIFGLHLTVKLMRDATRAAAARGNFDEVASRGDLE